MSNETFVSLVIAAAGWTYMVASFDDGFRKHIGAQALAVSVAAIVGVLAAGLVSEFRSLVSKDLDERAELMIGGLVALVVYLVKVWRLQPPGDDMR